MDAPTIRFDMLNVGRFIQSIEGSQVRISKTIVAASKDKVKNQFHNILCTICLAISYVYVLIFVQYWTISIAMTKTGSKANETTNLQTPSFK